MMNNISTSSGLRLVINGIYVFPAIHYDLMMLSVILLSMLMILLSILSVIRHLICGHNLNWLLNLNLDLRDTVEWEKKWLVGLNAGKTQLVSFDHSNNTGSIDVKMDGFVLEENHILKC